MDRKGQSAGLAKEKRILRKALKEKLFSLDGALCEKASAEIYEKLVSLPELDRAAVVFCYVSIPHEVETRTFIEYLIGRGKTVCVPRCMEDGIMEARAIKSLADLAPSPPFGIAEPDGSAELVGPARIDLAVVPGLAFDRQGRRLGKGGGYYDRFLAKCGAVKCGVCFDAMLEDVLPAGLFDVPMDIVLTDRAVIRLYNTEETYA
jgi:5-formyltetrahydrofolate cyclo-ligase